jgi:hypothetical protein
MCPLWSRKGWCRFGDRCKFIHDPAVPPRTSKQAQQQKQQKKQQKQQQQKQVQKQPEPDKNDKDDDDDDDNYNDRGVETHADVAVVVAVVDEGVKEMLRVREPVVSSATVSDDEMYTPTSVLFCQRCGDSISSSTGGYCGSCTVIGGNTSMKSSFGLVEDVVDVQVESSVFPFLSATTIAPSIPSASSASSASTSSFGSLQSIENKRRSSSGGLRLSLTAAPFVPTSSPSISTTSVVRTSSGGLAPIATSSSSSMFGGFDTTSLFASPSLVRGGGGGSLSPNVSVPQSNREESALGDWEGDLLTLRMLDENDEDV